MGSFIINWICLMGIIWHYRIGFMDTEDSIVEQQAAEIKRYQEVVFGLSMIIGALTTLFLIITSLTYYAYYLLD
jgi:hypothetical protein